MTRITNLGRKRTHVEATFNYHEADLDSDAGPLAGDAADESVAVANIKGVETAEDDRGADGQPPKKKRKRGPRKKAGVKAANGTCGEGRGGEKGDANEEGAGKNSKKSSEKKGKKGKDKSRTLQGSSTFSTCTFSRKFIRIILQTAKKLQRNDVGGG